MFVILFMICIHTYSIKGSCHLFYNKLTIKLALKNSEITFFQVEFATMLDVDSLGFTVKVESTSEFSCFLYLSLP